MADDLITAGCGFFFGAMLTIVIMLAVLDRSWKEKAIEAGVAEFVVDKYGAVDFQWIEPKQ